MSVLSKIKRRLDLFGGEKDDLLNDYIEEYSQKVLNYCHIDEIPVGLQPTLVSMVIDAYKSDYGLDKEVTSIKRGDTTIQYKSSSSKENETDYINKYRTDLNRFRKMKVI